MRLYAIKTGNRHNEFLIFSNHKDAVNWCKRATRWTDEEIKENIAELPRGPGMSFVLFPCSPIFNPKGGQ